VIGVALGRPANGESLGVSAEEYARFCEFFYRKTGILFNEQKRYFVERRILDRIRLTGSDGFREWFGLVRFQAAGQELQALVNAMTVNETYFFREIYQFEALVQGILPQMVQRRLPARPIRIWSLPCSTGEEPYSIGIHILENWPNADDYAIEILASDIDSGAMAKARVGVYDERSLQRVVPSLRARYFTRLGESQFQLRDEIRSSVEFAAVNVMDPASMARFRAIDVLFCRNMLIYFDDLSRRQAVEAMYECLAPGGFICLGHSESMSRMSSLFVPRKFGGVVVYQKPPGGE
jgi:chemotaxis protein methyltransferase CheR